MQKPDPVSGFAPKGFALLTLHRSENVDDKEILKGLVEGVISLNTEVLFSAHPRTLKRIRDFDLMKKFETSSTRVKIVEPLAYLDFLHVMQKCDFVITDSGGIQEEATAPSINKKVFVLRTSTERPEAVESGHAKIVGVDPTEFPKRILEEIETGLEGERECPFGDGKASKEIVDVLLDEM
jgi:UDP-N-acetylglucosamine 2-epimerase (non-hydrolysing)